MIRLAKNKDIDEIMDIIKIITEEMIRDENYQWDSDYPKKEVFLNDIKQKHLYIYEGKSGEVCGFICLDFNEPSVYKDIKWSSNEKALVIHRMATSSKFRGQGLAVKLMKFAEEFARSKNISYIHTDTYSTNKAMNGLFKKFDYQFVGTINMMDKPLQFNCYERKI